MATLFLNNLTTLPGPAPGANLTTMTRYFLKETPVKNGRPDETKWRTLRQLKASYVQEWPQSAQSLTGYFENYTVYREIFEETI